MVHTELLAAQFKILTCTVWMQLIGNLCYPAYYNALKVEHLGFGLFTNSHLANTHFKS